MKVIVKCSKCGKVLQILSGEINSLDDLVIKVPPCYNMGCYDCSKCDEVKSLKEQLEYQKLKLKRIADAVSEETKEKTGRELCFGEYDDENTEED